ncbi:hypothetical protein JW777_11110 [bacterium]|nr:hypothetical protein [bacterium]
MSVNIPSGILPSPDPVLIQFPDVPIPVGDVMRRLGYPSAGHDLSGGMDEILDSAMAEAGRLMDIRTSHRILEVASNDGFRILFKGSDLSIESAMVAKLLRRAPSVVCLAATAGIALDRAVSAGMDEGEMTEAYMLDAIGSETVEAAVDELHWKILKNRAEENGWKVTPRFSPGYGDWRLTIQTDLVRASGGTLIGISVTPSSLMIPRKSVTAVLGFEPAGAADPCG